MVGRRKTIDTMETISICAPVYADIVLHGPLERGILGWMEISR
jgi:hypothetical protein